MQEQWGKSTWATARYAYGGEGVVHERGYVGRQTVWRDQSLRGEMRNLKATLGCHLIVSYAEKKISQGCVSWVTGRAGGGG